tara:strand:+ start:85 stop:393 length:309 start_codon:yes stop_codon:yes gene_type:complete
MDTREYLINKLEKEFSVARYNQNVDWVMMHIDRIVTNYPHLKIGAVIKCDIDGFEVVSEVKDFYINCYIDNMSILVDTGYGNVWYFETSEASEKELQKHLLD